MLLWVGGFMSGPQVLAASTLVASGLDVGIASTAPTLQGTGLVTMINGDMGGSAEAGGPAIPPSCYNTLNCVII